jgi:hypothetical protein
MGLLEVAGMSDPVEEITTLAIDRLVGKGSQAIGNLKAAVNAIAVQEPSATDRLVGYALLELRENPDGTSHVRVSRDWPGRRNYLGALVEEILGAAENG